ncbi:MAG: peptidoglycan/xylan/chitin deacetylase (PgdA/CDA1 family) [Candidatus Azotimanducaceae bacterium]|jgi:peptidoglycan/xylan/chitin deacetylase (PgdA/CDA1 family)
MSKLRKTIKALLYYLGVYRLMIYLFSDRIPILMIHGVVDSEQGVQWTPSWERVQAVHFGKVLGVLARYYQFISIDEVADYLTARKKLTAPSLALTFDDGYRNCQTDAGPFLEKHHAPSTVYLATNHCVNQIPMWIDRLDYVLQSQQENIVNLELADHSFQIRTQPWTIYVADYRKFRLEIKRIFPDDRKLSIELEKEICRLEELSELQLNSIYADDSISKILSAAEVESTNAPMKFGSHTVHHLRVDSLDGETLTKELRQSKLDVEKLTHTECAHFCFPNGNYSHEAISELKKVGYETAVTVVNGSNKVGDADLLALRRFSFPAYSAEYEIVHAVVSNLLKADRLVSI